MKTRMNKVLSVEESLLSEDKVHTVLSVEESLLSEDQNEQSAVC